MSYLRYRHTHFSYIFSKYKEDTSLVHSTLIRKLTAPGDSSSLKPNAFFGPPQGPALLGR